MVIIAICVTSLEFEKEWQEPHPLWWPHFGFSKLQYHGLW